MIDEDDKQLFRDSVDVSIPIDKDGVNCTNRPLKEPPFTAYSYAYDADIGAEEIVSYAKSGISNKAIHRMKQGNIGYVAEIDLHGRKVKDACEMLSDFMYRQQFEQYVRIIHGKGYQSDTGMSILKTQVVKFLQQHPQVLAFHSCPQKDGGTGAVFALLKKIQD